MLNPPLSLLSDDLLYYIVEHIAKFPSHHKHLSSLSRSDRAFTQFCQAYFFRTLQLGGRSGSKQKVSRTLERLGKILNDKPSLANLVRKVHLASVHKQNVFLFEDRTFISILQLLSKSPNPPHELHFGGVPSRPIIIQEPLLMMELLMQSCFSQNLTVLHLTAYKNVPLPLFLICSRLREVLIDCVTASGESYDKYPDNMCSGRELPALELFNYRDSQSVVKQMITSPPRFRTPVVLWSNLRVLTLSPHEKEEMACLQPILDAACKRLEELYLTSLRVGKREQLPLAGLVNLSGLSQLRVCALYAVIKCDEQKSAVLHDINIVLGRIPASNNVTNLLFDIAILGEHPFVGCLDQDWVGISDQVIRISAGKPLELDLKTYVSSGMVPPKDHGQDELFMQIMKRTASLLDFPKICTHFWNPIYRTHEPGGSLPRGQVRSRCIGGRTLVDIAAFCKGRSTQATS